MDEESELKKMILKRVSQVAVQMLVVAAILFISSGRLDWWMAWIYLGISVVGVCINAAVLIRNDPDLIAERAHVGANTKGWDKVLASLFGVSSIAVLLTIGLDRRFGWSQQIPVAHQLVAMVFVTLGFVLASWALVSNAFFAATVRIQKERGHTVVSDGPYQYVRHPGYAGWILSGMFTPLMLGSLWALVPAVLTTLVLLVRTAFEDRTLREELDGYEAYALRVRCRLLPGVW